MEEEEVVLGLIPAPDWVENRPLEEGAEIELAVAKKLQHYQETDQIMEIKPKKEEDTIEEITLDSEDEEGGEIETTEKKHRVPVPIVFPAEKEAREIETTEKKHRGPVPIVFPAGMEAREIETTEKKHRGPVPIVFPAGMEAGEIETTEKKHCFPVPIVFPAGMEGGEIETTEKKHRIPVPVVFPVGKEGGEIETTEKKHFVPVPIVFPAGKEGGEIETTEKKHRVPVPIVFPAGKEGGEMNVKQEEELQIEETTEFPEAVEGGEMNVKQEEEFQIEEITEFPEAEENEDVNMHEEEEPHIEAVTVFSDSDEGESIQIKEEEELQIEAVTVYSDTEQSEEDTLLGQENKRYNMQNHGGNPLVLYVAGPQPTVVETTVQDVYGCNSCPKSFSCTAELSKHVRIHPPRGKPFVCRVCLKTDSLAANLKRHMRTHSGEKPYSCVLCTKMFTSAYSLKIHMRIHSGYKPYSCKKCPRAFYQKTDLNKHNIVHLRAERMLQFPRVLPKNRDSKSVEQNVEMPDLTEKVLSRCENSRVSNLLPGACNYMLSPQVTVIPVNSNSKTDDSRTVNSQTESPSNALRDMPIITGVVGSFHEEDSELQPCPSPTNNRQLQKQAALQPSSLAGKQIKMEKTVYSQPVINLVSPQVANSSSALPDTATPVSSPGGNQLAVKKSVFEQQEAYLSEEDSLSGQENERYNEQENGGKSLNLLVARPQATVIETVVQNVYGCNSCLASFASTGELVNHMQNHPPKRRPFICRVCLKTDSRASTFKRHMQSHSTGQSYECFLCFRLFTTAYSLKIHLMIHSGYKPHSCKKCPRTFYQKTDLIKHEADHVRTEKMAQDARESNSVDQNVKIRNILEAKVLSECANSRESNILPSENQLSVVPVNRNLKTVNAQTESQCNTLRDSPSPFPPVTPEVVGPVHKENTEIQPCTSPSSNRLLQKQVAFQPNSLAENQMKTDKAVNSQTVINSENLPVINSSGALQDTVIPVDNSGGKELSVRESVYEQSEAHSERSQNEADLGTTFHSPVQLPTDVVQNNSNFAASALNTTFVNNFMPSQPGGEMIYIPLIINGQMGYVIPAPMASQFVINNPPPVHMAAQHITSQTVSTRETFLLPAFVPPILNGVPSPNFSQPTAIPAVSSHPSVLENAIPSHPQHQIGFQFPPVSNVTPVWPENSSGSQMTIMNPCIQPENSTGSQITYRVPVPRGQMENSLGSQMVTMKTGPDIWPEYSSGSQITTVGMPHMANWKIPWDPR